jgi:hypothetical protein
MKFSTEAIVAAAIAIVFAVLSLGAIAREQGESSARTTNAYVSTSNSSVVQVAPGENDVLGFY